jgi:hypothetical protein
VRTHIKIAALIASSGILCGFAGELGYDVDAFRGQPIDAVVAKLGPPIQRQSFGGNRLYYWRVTSFGIRPYVCKVWGIVDRQGIVTNAGYQDCAF